MTKNGLRAVCDFSLETLKMHLHSPRSFEVRDFRSSPEIRDRSQCTGFPTERGSGKQ